MDLYPAMSLENLESVKTTPETNFIIFLMRNIEEFCDTEILHMLNRTLQLLCKLRNQQIDFP